MHKYTLRYGVALPDHTWFEGIHDFECEYDPSEFGMFRDLLWRRNVFSKNYTLHELSQKYHTWLISIDPA